MFSKLFDKTIKGEMFSEEFDKAKVRSKEKPNIQHRYIMDDTICELHRQIYDKLVLSFHDRPEELKEIVLILEKAFIVGIKMTQKLVEYKCSLPDWETNNSVEEVIRLRKLRVELAKKLEESMV